MNIYAGSMCQSCGRTARDSDKKPYHKCHKCGSRLKPNFGKGDVEKEEISDADRYKNFWRRCLAFIVDSILIAAAAFSLQYLSGIIWPSLTWLLVMLSVAIGPTYFVFCHFKYGQTIGKWIARIKVVDLSETRLLSLSQSLMRSIAPVVVSSFYCFIQLLISAQFWLNFSLDLQLQVKIMMMLIAAYIVVLAVEMAWVLLGVSTMFFNPKRRAIHDFLASSVVVKCEAACTNPISQTC